MELNDKNKAEVKAPRISLKGVNVSAPEPPLEVAKMPVFMFTDEEEILSRLAGKNPHTLELINRLELVSTKTGSPLRMPPGEIAPATNTPPPAPNVSKVRRSLNEVAATILAPETTYSREEILSLLVAKEGIEEQRAEAGFSAMLSAGVIQQAAPGSYYLAGSTPF